MVRSSISGQCECNFKIGTIVALVSRCFVELVEYIREKRGLRSADGVQSFVYLGSSNLEGAGKSSST